MITSVETCIEVPDSGEDDDEDHKQIGRQGGKIDGENLDITKLRICPEVPPSSVQKRMTLTKGAAPDSVYNILDKTKTSKKGKPRLHCKIEGCTEQAHGKYALYRHYCNCNAHFKEELLRLIDGRQENCPYCGLKFQRSNNAVGHVGYVHHKLEDFLPKHLHIKSNRMKKCSKAKPNVVSTMGQLYQAKKTDRTLSRTVSDFSCGLCVNKKFGRRHHLYEHYSLVHYRAQLRHFIDAESAECSRCKIILKNPTEANKIRHMGVVHGLLEEKNILQGHLWVPKSKIGLAVR